MARFLTQQLSFLTLSFLLSSLSTHTNSLTTDYYGAACPDVENTVEEVVSAAIEDDFTIGPSLLRLHFHDCIVMGCDASVLLDNSTDFQSEKEAKPNKDSLRGFQVIDEIKSKLEVQCPGIVSCADILAIAAQVAVSLAGGPSWDVKLGRKDSRTAFFKEANTTIPKPTANLSSLLNSFKTFGFDMKDVIVLSGGHTFGRAHCKFFKSRLYNFNNTGHPDPSLNTTYLNTLRSLCPINGEDSLIHLDGSCQKCEPDFDNNYYSNLLSGKGLLFSDQVLQTDGNKEARNFIEIYSRNTSAFFSDFVTSMIKLGDITFLSEHDGEIRRDCHKVNVV